MTWANPDVCPTPILTQDDRHIATLVDDPTKPMVNDAGEVFYLKNLLRVCQGCGAELSGASSGRWRAEQGPIIEEEPV